MPRLEEPERLERSVPRSSIVRPATDPTARTRARRNTPLAMNTPVDMSASRSVGIASQFSRRILSHRPSWTSSNTQRKQLFPDGKMHDDVEDLAEKEQNADLKRMLRATARMGNEGKVVPRSSITSYLEDLIDAKQRCKMIPFIIMYFVFFALSLMWYENIQDLSQVERNLRGMLEGSGFEGYNTVPGLSVSGHKTMDDIDTIADVYTYLHEVIIPLFVMDATSTAPNDMKRVLRYNQIVGGLHLQQLRIREVDCSKQYATLGPFNSEEENPFLVNFSCYPSIASSSCFGPGQGVEGFCPLQDEGPSTAPLVPYRRLVSAATSVKQKLASGQARVSIADKGTLFSVSLPSMRGADVAYRTVQRLRDHNWLDLNTIWFGIRMFVLNPDLGVFSSVVANIYFAPSGELVPEVKASTFLASPFPSVQSAVVSILWALLWLHLLATCVISLVKACPGPNRLGQLYAYFMDVFNIIEWGSCLGGIVVIFLWVFYRLKLGDLRQQALELTMSEQALVNAPGGASGSANAAFHSETVAFAVTSSEFDDFAEFYRVYMGWYTIGIIMRFFRAFMAQPRLAVVTHTLIASCPSLVHYLIVFFIMVASFSASAAILFGHRLVEFSSIGFSLQTTAQITLGNFDLEELMDDSPVTASLWFLVFNVVTTLIMINMFLAIVLDTYSSAKQEAAFVDSIWDQTKVFFEDIVYRNSKVSDHRLLVLAQGMELRNIGKHDLCRECPDLSVEQASALIAKVEVKEANTDNLSLSLSDATRLMLSVKALLIHSVNVLNKILRQRVIVADQANVNMVMAELAGSQWSLGMKDVRRQFDRVSEERVQEVEERLTVLEAALSEAMSYVNYRGDEVVERLTAIESALSGQKNQSAGNATALLKLGRTLRARANGPNAMPGR